jgi:hypothetical protein
MTELTSWQNFYVITGSSAGALIGLQFVVMALIANMPTARGDDQAGSAFTTPSVVHFGVVLLLSAVAEAPWGGVNIVDVLWGALGIGGIAYTVIVIRRMKAQTVYLPVFEDWLFHILLPIAAYTLLVTSSFLVCAHESIALFFIGGAALMLLIVGIHNAWDTVMHLVFVRKGKRRKTERTF